MRAFTIHRQTSNWIIQMSELIMSRAPFSATGSLASLSYKLARTQDLLSLNSKKISLTSCRLSVIVVLLTGEDSH